MLGTASAMARLHRRSCGGSATLAPHRLRAPYLCEESWDPVRCAWECVWVCAWPVGGPQWIGVCLPLEPRFEPLEPA